MFFLAQTVKGYHFRKTREGRVMRRVPYPWFVRVGLSFDFGFWFWGAPIPKNLKRYYGKGRSAFCDVQLLPEAAVSEGRSGICWDRFVGVLKQDKCKTKDNFNPKNPPLQIKRWGTLRIFSSCVSWQDCRPVASGGEGVRRLLSGPPAHPPCLFCCVSWRD